MAKYIVKRVLTSVLVTFLVSLIVFVVIHITPGNPAASILGPEATQEQIIELNRKLGLDKPVAEQYIDWVGKALHGDLGLSYYRNNTVSESVAEHFAPTFELAIWAQLIAIIIAMPAGIFAAKNKGTVKDGTVIGFVLLGMSVPGFLLGIFMMLLFAVKLNWFPVAGYVPWAEGALKHIRYMVLPAFTLGIMQSALITRITRASMVEVMSSDYIKTAKAKGVAPKAILYKHALKNAMNVILTTIGNSFANLVAGAAVIETVYNIPGLGQLAMNSVTTRDYPVLQGVVIVICVMLVVINLVIDLLYGVFDPRVRLTGK